MNLTAIIIEGSLDELASALQITQDVNLLDEYGYTPLIECVIQNDLEKAKLIKARGADVNQADITGRHALHWAVRNNNLPISEWLLSCGANPNAYHLAGEPVLATPILQQNIKLKNKLAEYGASFTFAYDYINAKLLGHRYELIGSADIAGPDNVFIEVDYEGFYLDASLNLIRFSLRNFKENYAARYIKPWFNQIDAMIEALQIASELLTYDHYLFDYRTQAEKIIPLFARESLIIPINQEGHAFTLVKSGSLFAVCDRARSDEHHLETEIIIDYMNRLSGFQANNMMPLIYEKQSITTIKDHLKNLLRLQPIASIEMPTQKIGNCSWANVEAIIPVLHFMLQLNQQNKSKSKEQLMVDSMELFHRWREWERQRALQFFLNEFPNATEGRRASIAALLAGVIFQTCSADNPSDVNRAKKMIKAIKKHHHDYVFDSYLTVYVNQKSTEAGKNLVRLLEIYEREEAF